ncbi:MAG: calcium/sodium antiporter [Deltaproteobacteria bacterium]|nr:calcium/sodium antiporter [Deltaproteobacteria bacterium]MBW2068465.1 calcium/sodium antiporter [Deltaproteobacteria bacterium]
MVVGYFAAVATGIVGLVWGADRFIESAVRLARRFNISPLIIGLTVVSFGTSMPELVTTLMASLTGHPSVAVGNVVGSNIANICLILGIAALFKPLTTNVSMMRREYPFLVAVSIIVWLMALNGKFGRIEGGLLCGGLVAFIGWMIKSARDSEIAKSFLKDIPLENAADGIWGIIIKLALGLAVLTGGSRALVWGGVGIARWIGVNELIIGLSLVALGTSLPELAASIAGIIKKEDDIAVGNVVGSNLFNSLAILGIPALARPIPVTAEALSRDLPIMVLITLMLWPIARPKHNETGLITRWKAGVLLFIYCAYMIFIFAGGKLGF